MLFTVHHDAEKTHCVEIHVGRQYQQHQFRLELCILTLISVHLQLKIGSTPTIHGLLKIIVKNNNVVPYFGHRHLYSTITLDIFVHALLIKEHCFLM